ncbi:WXG100 family type VII secretion target [Nocardia sp. BMG51109]|uniref:WXG100 family type VII secretion target n=1 Tax=Nocardia sp. BMG51109 TaxID=1056816 RepID=UPI00046738CB|nr:WXG100 family type VII secretion target [Nocardia sp. BMG51109]
MTEQVTVDPQQLRAAAGRLDGLFNDSGAALAETDRSIADSRDGWKQSAAGAFGRFNGYLDGRRALLQRNLGELSESLKTTANNFQSQEESSAAAIDEQAPQSPWLKI